MKINYSIITFESITLNAFQVKFDPSSAITSERLKHLAANSIKLSAHKNKKHQLSQQQKQATQKHRRQNTNARVTIHCLYTRKQNRFYVAVIQIQRIHIRLNVITFIRVKSTLFSYHFNYTHIGNIEM